MADREKGKEYRNTNIWISRERKELFRWNKKHFSKLFKDYHLVKKWKIKGTSFTPLAINKYVRRTLLTLLTPCRQWMLCGKDPFDFATPCQEWILCYKDF